VAAPINAVVGIGLTLTGVPVYFFRRNIMKDENDVNDVVTENN
jgi:hypothetical protein